MPVLRGLSPLLAALVVCSTVAMTASTPVRARPRLAVVVVFDQLPMWLLERTEPFFGKGGFGGLDGATYSAWYNYAGTETAPGHATLLTGANPAVHGIATNTWYQDGKPRYVTEDDAHPVLAPTVDNPAGRLTRGSSPQMLLVPTLGDAMKADSAGKAKVVTLSHKDRAAVLSAGQSGDLAVWYDRELGRYTTSTAYRDTLPPWLLEQGASLPATARASGTWEPLAVPPSLQGLVPDDDRAGEGGLKGMGKTFPHHLKDVVDVKDQFSAYRLTPQSIDDLLALALAAVDHEGLGQDDEPDLLVVSVSTTDVVGHNYGPESLEQLDTLRRADHSLRRFLVDVRQRVRGDVVVAVTSDHGVQPLPQTVNAAGFIAPTVTYEDVVATADRALQRVAPRKDGSSRVQGFFPPQLFVDVSDLSTTATDAAFGAVATAVEDMPGLARVYDMRPGRPDLDSFHEVMRQSAPPGRSSLLFVRAEPRVLMTEKKYLGTGTDHGTVYSYDRRVPLLLSGPGVQRGRFAQRVDVRDVAASVAFLLGVSPPDACQGSPVPAAGR
jgi:predicted AlkP superfamily pyrophosphatase or phosphodiesterase